MDKVRTEIIVKVLRRDPAAIQELTGSEMKVLEQWYRGRGSFAANKKQVDKKHV